MFNKTFIILSKLFFLSILVVFSIIQTGCYNMGKRYFNDSRIFVEITDKWVENTLSQMTLEEKAGQMVFPNVNGVYMSEDSPEYQRLVHLVRDRNVGGLIFFVSDLCEQVVLTNKMQRLAKIPLLIAADYEHGISMRIEGATPFPNIMALGAIDDEKLTYEMAKVIAIESRAIGVHQNYAPVSDVNNNPANPIINIRSFGESPELVARHSNAFLKGLQDGGMIATSKHFPGHGNTGIDSHLDLPVLKSSLNELEEIELYPFKENIKSGVMSIMVGHLSVPAIEGDSGIPSSLSEKIITDLLKKKLEFNGLIVTDALNMHGITKFYSTKEATIQAIKAGHDCILYPDDADETIDAIIEAVKRGDISESRLDESVRKILTAKKWLELNDERFIDIDKIASVVGKNEHLELAKTISRKSITLLKNENDLIPIKETVKKFAHIVIVDSKNDYDGELFRRHLHKKIPHIKSAKILINSGEDDYFSALEICKDAEIIVVSVYSKVRSYQGKVGISDKQKNFVKQILKLGKPVIMIGHGNPYVLADFPEVNVYLNNYSDTKFSELAIIEAIFGEINIEGKSPISIPEANVKIGDGIKVKRIN